MASFNGKAVSLEMRPSGVAVITINVPGTSMNVLARAVLAEFDQALDVVKKDIDIKGLVIRSGKPDSFIAGADINEIAALQSVRSAIRQAVIDGKNVLQKLEDLSDEMNTVAAVNGICLGGGFELILACTHRIATDKSEFGLPEGTLGVLPGFGGCVRLVELIGAPEAAPVILKARSRTNAKKAWRVGMIDEVVKNDQLLARAEEIAAGKEPRRAKQGFGSRFQRWLVHSTGPIGRAQFAKKVIPGLKKEAGKNYPAPWAAFEVIKAAMTKDFDEAMEFETEQFADMAITDVSANLVGMYFAIQDSKKTPNNARPNIKPGMIGVAGAGVMGLKIAFVCLLAGFPVILYDAFPQQLPKALDQISALFDYLVKKGKISRDQENNFLSSLGRTSDVEGLKNCDVVIEAIIENMDKKKEFVAKLEEVKGDKPYIFASNTSSLSIAEMTAGMKVPGNAVGMHWFNPADRMPLIEVVQAPNTSDETVASMLRLVARLSGKFSVITKDGPGFVVNRILVPYAYEAIKLLEMGVPPEDIEAAMLDFGMAMGPLHVLDEVGLDVGGKVVHILNGALGDRLAPPKLLNWIEGQKGLLGKKTGKGMFIWENDEKKGFNPEILAALNVQPRSMSREEIQKRLVGVMMNEASQVLAEGIVSNASQVDLAMIMGCGFPPYRGGILRYADKLGAPKVVETLSELHGKQNAGGNFKPSALLLDMAANGRKFYA
jgi:3-hydroxyacyl-CoA dehydrogenase/enoyl-CoA hydratase/3-hydroxybutyryl-CoA epimerase